MSVGYISRFIAGVAMLLFPVYIYDQSIPNYNEMRDVQGYCIRDHAHEILLPVTLFVRDHERIHKTLLLVSQLGIDTMYALFVAQLVCQKNAIECFNTFLQFAVFYSARMCLQLTTQLPKPANYQFEDPGFPSIAVSYIERGDYFVSGHAGFSLLSYLVSRQQGRSLQALFCLSQVVFQSLFVLVENCHYLIDVIGGLLLADFVHRRLTITRNCSKKVRPEEQTKQGQLLNSSHKIE